MQGRSPTTGATAPFIGQLLMNRQSQSGTRSGNEREGSANLRNHRKDEHWEKALFVG